MNDFHRMLAFIIAGAAVFKAAVTWHAYLNAPVPSEIEAETGWIILAMALAFCYCLYYATTSPSNFD